MAQNSFKRPHLHTVIQSRDRHLIDGPSIGSVIWHAHKNHLCKTMDVKYSSLIDQRANLYIRRFYLRELFNQYNRRTNIMTWAINKVRQPETAISLIIFLPLFTLHPKIV